MFPSVGLIVTLRLRRQVLLLVFAFLALIIGDGGPAAEACSLPVGWKEPSDIEKVMNAAMVVYGRVRATYPDERFSYAGQFCVYTANIEVFCIMKGSRTERFINISEAGTESKSKSK